MLLLFSLVGATTAEAKSELILISWL